MKNTNEKYDGYQDHDTISRRTANMLHERIDQASDKGEQFEHVLQEKGEKMKEKTSEIKKDLEKYSRANPWAVVGGSLAVGILIGAFVRRR